MKVFGKKKGEDILNIICVLTSLLRLIFCFIVHIFNFN